VPENALTRKLRLKPGNRAAIVGCPDGYLTELEPLPEGVTMDIGRLEGTYQWLQVFARTQSELDELIQRIREVIAPDGLVWFSFPKGTSKIQTDLTRDTGWDALSALNLKWVTLVSVNATWSAFALRPYRPGEAPQSFR